MDLSQYLATTWKICKDDDEMEKYLMTFQNLLSKIPEWNETIIEYRTNSYN